MFYYYGRKQRIVNSYPKPIHDIIIEPFAGSAAYSFNHHEKKVILSDLDPKIYSVWSYIINEATKDDILSLPILEKGVSLNDSYYDYIPDKMKWLMGFFLNPGSAQPKKSMGSFSAWNEKNREKLSEDVLKVKHWEIFNTTYEHLVNIESTWFIDPPYQGNGGQYYRFGNKNFDYDKLKKWVLTRNGQIIVCENSEATWMDFTPLVELKGQKGKTSEVIYYIENN